MISTTSREHESTRTTSSPQRKCSSGQSAATTTISGGNGTSAIPVGKGAPIDTETLLLSMRFAVGRCSLDYFAFWTCQNVLFVIWRIIGDRPPP
jgi:hypothetical protein